MGMAICGCLQGEEEAWKWKAEFKKWVWGKIERKMKAMLQVSNWRSA